MQPGTIKPARRRAGPFRCRLHLKPGSTLLIPRGAKVEDDVPEKVADNGQINLAPEIVLRKMAVKARKGETVGALARRYKVSAVQVAQWNDMAVNTALNAGQSVVLYVPARASAKPKSGTRVAAKGSARGKAVAKSAAKPVRVAKR